MKQIKTIVFPTDFSRSSNFVWSHTLLHAERHRAKVVLLH